MEAMAQAARKPRGYGMREDEDQRELEALSADLLCMEDALFFPTCTMANQVALMLHCPRGSHVLVDSTSHVCGTEASSTTGIAGAVIAGVEGRMGHPVPAQVADMLEKPVAEAQMPIRLVWLENTHNVAGGTVMPPQDFRAIVDIARRSGVPIHVDGARLWNAAAYSRAPAAELVHGADSVAFSLNKALGAPLGAVLAGSRAFVAESLRTRNMMGGGWRPTGILAAGALVALREGQARLVDDHRRAARLADAMMGIEGLEIDRERVQTNIVVVRPTALLRSDLMTALQARGILVTPHRLHGIRMVLHAGIDDHDIGVVADTLSSIVRTSGDEAASRPLANRDPRP
jgi:threonine aldolase